MTLPYVVVFFILKMLIREGATGAGFEVSLKVFCLGRIFKTDNRLEFPWFEFARMDGLAVVVLRQTFVQVCREADVKMLR